MNQAKVIFYDYDRLQSFSSAIFCFILASRGVGKTYGAIKACIKDFIKNGNQFIYVRRYKSELKTCVPNFFDALIANKEFPDHELTVKNGKFYVDGELAGYSIALSTSKILKSTSFPLVRTIIYDEFTITTGVYHYLNHEVEDLLDLYETTARMREGVRVWFLGNATTAYNPFFNYFGLSIPHAGEFKTFKDGLILVNYVVNTAFAEAKRQTAFGRLVEGTKWGGYAIDNQFLQDSTSFIHKRPPDADFFFNLHVAGNVFGIWMDDDGYWYVSHDHDPDSHANFAFTKDDHTETTMLRSKVDPIIKNLLERYREAMLVFEDQQIKGCLVNNLLKYSN